MNPTFDAMLGRWLALHTQGRKPSTVKFNREIVAAIRRHWTGPPGEPADQVTIDQVAAVADRLAVFCPSRWNAMVAAIRFAAPQASGGLRKRRLRSKERPMLDQLEFHRLLDECDRLPKSNAGLVVRFLAHTGLRIGEATQLRWQDVGADSIRVSAISTKNGLPRVIPFVNGIQATLAKLRRIGDGIFVLPRKRIRRGLEKACERAGLPRLSHHDFRHLFATRCIQSGVDIPTVARWLGHSDGGALLARLYFHLADEHGRRMAAKVVI